MNTDETPPEDLQSTKVDDDFRPTETALPPDSPSPGSTSRKEARMFARIALMACVVIVLTSTSCQPPAPAIGPLSEEDVEAIEALGASVDEAVLALDWDALVALMTDDVLLMFPSSGEIPGRLRLQSVDRINGGNKRDRAQARVSRHRRLRRCCLRLGHVHRSVYSRGCGHAD